MEIYGKRIIILRQLFEKQGADLATFMDKSGLSFEFIDCLLCGKHDSINEEELKAFASGVDMSAAKLRAYLELCVFF